MTTAKNTASNTTTEFEQAKDAASEAYENFMKAQKHLKSAAFAAGVDLKDSANEQLEEKAALLKKQQKALLKNSQQYIQDNPLASAGIAFASGYIVSKLLSK